jgi:replicative DNA helicase
MFIYREDTINPTEENNGLAELIISKQRNGPTGSVQLAFSRQFTKFDNLYQE